MVLFMMALDVDRLCESLAAAVVELPELRLAYLFGSRVTGRMHAESDLDLAVLVTREAAVDRHRELSRLFDRLARVVPSERLDIVLLNDAPSLLRHRVLRDGRLLFTRDVPTRVRFAARAIQDYQDMQVRRESFYRRRVDRIRRNEDHGRSGNLLAQARRVARLLAEAEGVPRC